MIIGCPYTAQRCALYLHSLLGAIALVLFSGVVPNYAHAGHTLTFIQALHLAQERSRQLVAQEAAADAARSLAVAAGRLPDPTLQLGINNLPISGMDQFSIGRDFMTMRSYGVAQEFVRPEKRQARAARFEREAEGAEVGRELALATLQRETALAWLERYYQEAIRTLLVQQRDEAKLQINAAESAYRSNRGPQVDVFISRSSVAQIEDQIAQIERQILIAKTMLSRWIGDEAEAPLGEKPTIETTHLKDTDFATQLNHHSVLAVLAKQEEIASAEAEIARTNKKTDWNMAMAYNQRGSVYSDMVSVGISIPLQWDQRNRQDRELSARLSLVERVRAQREEAVRAHVAEVRSMLQEWQSNRDRFTRYDETLIPLARERTQAALVGYRAGTDTLNTVLDARRNEITIRTERLKLELETARLWARLNFQTPTDHSTSSGH
jgi:outer membrane protein TolC